VDDVRQLCRVAECLEGNLNGLFLLDLSGSDDAVYDQVAPVLRERVGRLLNDKMPTGVAVSPAMNMAVPTGDRPRRIHGGGHPASLRRFAMLQCYDNVRPARLPAGLRDANPQGSMWRLVDGRWTRDDVMT